MRFADPEVIATERTSVRVKVRTFWSAHVAQLVEHVLGKDEVTGSIPVVSSRDFTPIRSRSVLSAISTSGGNSIGRVTAFQAVGCGFESRLPLSSFSVARGSVSQRFASNPKVLVEHSSPLIPLRVLSFVVAANSAVITDRWNITIDPISACSETPPENTVPENRRTMAANLAFTTVWVWFRARVLPGSVSLVSPTVSPPRTFGQPAGLRRRCGSLSGRDAHHPGRRDDPAQFHDAGVSYTGFGRGGADDLHVCNGVDCNLPMFSQFSPFSLLDRCGPG